MNENGTKSMADHTTDKMQFIGSGVLGWNASERQTDRYGTVGLFDENDNLIRLEHLSGCYGRLVAKVILAREASHLGDWVRGLSTETPEENEIIVLGDGILFFWDWLEEGEDGTYVGLGQLDRDTDWLNLRALYRLHDQTVELYFEKTRDIVEQHEFGPPD